MTTTIRHTIKFALLTVMFLALHVDTFSQIKVVTGFVYNLTEYNSDDSSIHAYNSEEMAKDDLKRYKDTPPGDLLIKDFTFNHDDETKVDEYGNFEIEVAITGALLVQYGLTEPKLVPVNGQLQMEIGIEVGIGLETVEARGKFTGIGKLDHHRSSMATY